MGHVCWKGAGLCNDMLAHAEERLETSSATGCRHAGVQTVSRIFAHHLNNNSIAGI
jgi:hypothetical protein